jgi:integrase/recombinase XerD
MDIYFKGDNVMGKLRDQMQEDLQLWGITPGTQATYLREVSNLALYFKKSPEELGERELKEYLLYLINDKKLPEGTYRNYYSGLKFLYKHTLKREGVMEKILCPKGGRSFPC